MRRSPARRWPSFATMKPDFPAGFSSQALRLVRPGETSFHGSVKGKSPAGSDGGTFSAARRLTAPQRPSISAAQIWRGRKRRTIEAPSFPAGGVEWSGRVTRSRLRGRLHVGHAREVGQRAANVNGHLISGGVRSSLHGVADIRGLRHLERRHGRGDRQLLRKSDFQEPLFDFHVARNDGNIPGAVHGAADLQALRFADVDDFLKGDGSAEVLLIRRRPAAQQVLRPSNRCWRPNDRPASSVRSCRKARRPSARWDPAEGSP